MQIKNLIPLLRKDTTCILKIKDKNITKVLLPSDLKTVENYKVLSIVPCNNSFQINVREK